MVKRTYQGYKRGQCNVGADRGVLRISVPQKFFDGKRRFIYTGLRDTTHNVREVQRVADLMNSDIFRGDFDFSLRRYRNLITPKGLVRRNQSQYKGLIPGVHAESLLELWDEWVLSLSLSAEKLNTHYAWTRKWIAKYNPAIDEVAWVQKLPLQSSTINNYLNYIRACVD